MSEETYIIINCPDCNGRGHEGAQFWDVNLFGMFQKCKTCGGSGHMVVERKDMRQVGVSK